MDSPINELFFGMKHWLVVLYFLRKIKKLSFSKNNYWVIGNPELGRECSLPEREGRQSLCPALPMLWKRRKIWLRILGTVLFYWRNYHWAIMHLHAYINTLTLTSAVQLRSKVFLVFGRIIANVIISGRNVMFSLLRINERVYCSVFFLFSFSSSRSAADVFLYLRRKLYFERDCVKCHYGKSVDCSFSAQMVYCTY